MAKSGIRSLNGNQYYYAEANTGESVAIGMQSSSGHIHVVVSPLPDADPNGTPIIDIESGPNGNIDITPNGSGSVILPNATIEGGSIDGTTLGAVTPSSVNATSYELNGVPVSFGGTTWVDSGAGPTASLNGGEGMKVLWFAPGTITLNGVADGDSFKIVPIAGTSGYSVVGDSGQQFSVAGTSGTTLTAGTLPYATLDIVYLSGVFYVTSMTAGIDLA